jgi:peroxiredoxin
MNEPTPALPAASPRALRIGAVALGLALTGLVLATPVQADGFDLDGRMAPDLVFSTGSNGVTPGMRLSSLRGKVVWLKFMLRDCPLCRASLPKAQELHERWGGSGLVVLAVVHQYGPDEMRAFLQQNGYTFLVGTDPDGELARRYGVRHRPTDYVIGVDGRIKASNGAPEDVIRHELGNYRLARLGEVPAGLAPVRDAVWRWSYGEALRLLAAADESEARREAEQRVLALAGEELDGRLAWGRALAAAHRVAEARALYDRLLQMFQGTALEARVKAARDELGDS